MASNHRGTAIAHESHQRLEQTPKATDRAVGLVFAFIFLAIGLYPWLFGRAAHTWALSVAALFAVVAVFVPGVLAPLNRVWARLGALLHRITSPIALAVMFFLLITPMGLVMRWLGKDPLRLRLDPDLPSYWLERVPPGPQPDTLTDQF